MAELEIKAFKSQEAFRAWVDEHHDTSEGIWLRMYKKATGKPTVTYPEALDVALCYGWIDSQMKSYDAESYIQRFGPRKSKSVWSKINRDHIARLIKEGNMQQAGLKAVEEAKANGQWEAAYDSSSTMTVPEDFAKALEGNKKAKAFFATLNKTNRYAVLWRVQTAKRPETRQKRIASLIATLEAGKKFH